MESTTGSTEHHILTYKYWDNDDWEEWYFDNILVYDGHGIDPYDLIKILIAKGIPLELEIECVKDDEEGLEE